MSDRLCRAADHFSVTLRDAPVFGWRDRTVGSRVCGVAGDGWLRVSWALTHWAEGDYWTGNEQASTIVGVPKPHVMNLYEWDEQDARVRAELMTLIPELPCSATAELRGDLTLPDQWWRDLKSALDALAPQTTDRTVLTQRQAGRRTLAFFGSVVDPTVSRWCTAHGDLNWSNITAPGLALLDWESFGTAPAGYDAATLYCLALKAPATANQVHDVFADVLDSPDGIRSQLLVIARYLKRVEYGEFGDLADLFHNHAHHLIAKFDLLSRCQQVMRDPAGLGQETAD